MRNLRSIRHDVCDLPADITASCWDPAKDEILITTGPTEDNAKISLSRIIEDPHTFKLKTETVASWDAPSPNPDLTVDHIISLHHFSDSSTTCVVLAGGDIITIQESDTSTAPHIEITGSIDAGILAARWSPDSELLLLITALPSAVLMSRSFDGVAETPLAAEDLALSRHVSVGWGKKETQFHGKGAKAKARDALRDPTVPESVDDGKRAANDDGKAVEISWRGDGAYVAVNAAMEGERRAVRVYTREGVLDSVSEPVDGLESGVSWRPSGNLIACVQRLGKEKADVVFFERNGLKHGQFELRFPDGVSRPEGLIKLEWNSDSTVLAVGFADVVQLWTTGNYHWYLKQEIRTSPGLSGLAWHPEKSLRLAAAASGRALSTEFIFDTSRGSLAAPNDHGAVAVIDGKHVKVTPLRTANVPPPMALFEVTASASVIDVAFSNDNSAMAVLHQSGVDLYAWQTRDGRSIIPKLRKTLDFRDLQLAPELPTVLQICFSGEERLYVLYCSGESSVASLAIDPTTGDGKLEDTFPVSPGSTMKAKSDGDTVRLQDRRGKLSTLGGTSMREQGIKFPMQLPWTEIATVDDEIIAFGLSRGGQLYANGRLLTKGCTSFVVTPDHLILTTSNHFLKFVHLASVDDLQVPADDPETDERCRSIERGAKLVTAMPTNMNLVLQMPRGNLETIFPRAMVLAGIRRLIEESNYARAFSYCRTQRVDMNILYDHRPEQFLANVSHFLDELKDASYIDLFLSSLKSEDVSQTMYKDTRPSKTGTTMAHPFSNGVTPAPVIAPQAPKINTICDAVLKSLKARKNANLQNIITAHVCKDPPALEDGLLVVADMMQEDERLAERAVEHICFLVDVNRLYDHALGLYNLDLSLLVAQQSQRDPREYLPFVQNLHKMPELRRKFTIDDHLGHRTKALAHLQSLDAFEELRDYTIKHTLYQPALALYRRDEPNHRTLTALYADYLEATSQHRAAALAYESLGDLPRATANYKSAGASSWRECLSTALSQTPPLSSPFLSELATSLADALIEAKDYASAATIHLDHLHSPDAALRLLCRGYLFADALRIAALAGRPDLLTSAVDPGLGDALSSTTEFLADCKAQLKAQVPRILELRRKAAEDPLAFYEGNPRGGGDVPDDISVAASSRLSTSASLFTRYTGKSGTATIASGSSRYSSKMRKREEKKRARGRKGTVYEEEYLVSSVRRLVERVEGAKGELERLVFGLVRRGMLERARAVEGLMGEVVVACRGAIGEVWPGSLVKKTRTTLERDGDEDGVAGMDEEAMLEAARKAAEPPAISDFAKMSLLG